LITNFSRESGDISSLRYRVKIGYMIKIGYKIKIRYRIDVGYMIKTGHRINIGYRIKIGYTGPAINLQWSFVSCQFVLSIQKNGSILFKIK
jgi:hypothetical protein